MSRPAVPLVHSLSTLARSHPDRPAFVAEDGSVSFEQFGRLISAVASRLEREGVASGDRILICAPNGVPWAAAYFAVHAAGCIAVPVDFDAQPETVRQVAVQSQARLVLTAKELAIPVPSLALLSACDARQAHSRLNPACGLNDVADILYTTGTTGSSKGVVLTHAQIAQAAANINAFIGSQAGDVEVVPIPLSHSFGLGRLRCMAQTGATLSLEAGLRNAAAILQRILGLKATGLALLPAGFELFLRMTKDRLGDARGHLRYIEIGSASMRLETKRKLMELLPETRICHHYGLTEASRAAFLEYHGNRDRLTSIGRPAPNVEIVVRNHEGHDAQPGEQGELLVRGGMVFKEYWQQPELTRKALHDGWLHTGDWGYRDAEGYFYLAGRRTDLINMAGMKVAPEEVEQTLNAHPAVVESACIGVADPQGLTGQCVKAFVVLRTAIADVELVAWLRSRLEEYKIPCLWERVDSIPKTASGKIQRQLLQRDKQGD
jgi:long-chain acyl-CoA synthetase